MKKIWYAFIIIILGAGAVFLGYYFRPKSKLAQTYLDNAISTSSAPATANYSQKSSTEGLSPVFKEPVLAYFPSANGWSAVDTSGRVVWTDGKSELTLSSSTVPFIFSASASYDGQYILMALGENSNPQFRIWDEAKSIWKFLPSGASSPSFSPNSHQLVYLQETANGTRLIILNLDLASSPGSTASTLPLIDLTARWIAPDKIELKDRGALLAQSSDFIYTLSKKTVNPAVMDKNGLDISWSSSGKTGLALLGQAMGGDMFLVDGSGQILQTLNILTLPEKCAWSGDQGVFCAIPQDQDALKTTLPDSFYKNSVFTNDNFYEIDAASGNVTPVLENKNGLDAESLTVYGNNLYFINRLDGMVYSLPIPK